MRSRNDWRAAASVAAAALVLGACGAGVATTESLARLADVVATALDDRDGCRAGTAARRLQKAVIRAINSRELPPGELEQTLGDVNELVATVGCGRAPTERAAALAHSLAERFRRVTRGA